MATNFPSGLDSFTNPSATDSMDSVSVPHASQHANLNDAVEALEAKVGVDGSADTGSLDYKVAQQGLVLVKTQTITGTPSSVSVTNVFSSTFDNYRILFDQMNANGPNTLLFQFTGAASSYYGSYMFDQHTGTTGAARVSNGSYLYISTVSSASDSSTCFDCFSPHVNTKSRISGTGIGVGYTEWFGGTQFADNSFTGFTVYITAGNLAGGTIRVYGYNNG